MRRVREKLDGYFGIEVDCMGSAGGLAFMWKNELDCSLLTTSVHHIDLLVKEGGREWRVTGFYGWHVVSDRHLSWELHRLLSGQSDVPWLCMGDFNEVLFSTEMKGGSRPQWQMNNFRTAIDDCGLTGIGWEGYQFTWDNGQAGEANKQSMIDRAMCTSSWLELFPYAKLIHLTREWSDHALIKLLLDRRATVIEVKRDFKFEQMWIGEEGCEEAIRRGVGKGCGELGAAINECAKELQAWKKSSIRKIGYMVERKCKQLDRLSEGSRTEEEIRKRKKLVSELLPFDAKKNNIGGNVLGLYGYRMVTAIPNFSILERELFASTQSRNFDAMLMGLEGRVHNRMNERLRLEYREEEVVEVLNQMHPLKAPGPDDMNALFFQSFWHIIGSDVIATVLANRLKGFIGEIVSENQSAFTPAGLITDNVLIAFEMFHHMKCSSNAEGGMAIKLDMAKAYDRVEWVFLRRVLEVMDFDRDWVSRVMACVSSVSFSVLINGVPTDNFRPQRGLHQGDLLSPYLFILCAEALSNLVRRAVERGSLTGLRISSSAPTISHLFFADDSIFFVKANEEEAGVVNDILRRYEAASGQLARYFRTGDFMTADVGYRLSYTWRSILGARTVLERGLRRRIGDGRDTRVWGHAWVEGNESGKVISPCGPGSEAMNVADLLKPHGRGWDKELVERMFLPFEAIRILNIRTSPNMPRDDCVAKWVWSSLNLDGAEEEDMADGVGEVRDWVEGIWRAGDAREVEKYMVGCWAIWEHMNKVAFDGAMIEPDRIVRRARDILSERG
ncbi:uncharacterized protein LOC141637980 [Silene latifolia]|uniref:uncharacterized protein LOC141637980 n=1 Tax=Silene latifolia TaxID=37657 RepID=UPI003D787D72